MRLPRLSRTIPSAEPPPTNDLGFGTQITDTRHRLINKDGSFNITRRGRAAWTLYQSMVELTWLKFFGVVILYYLGVNALFALGFLLLGIEQLAGIITEGGFADFAQAFFFSVQTFTTVGYGAVNPEGTAANLLASMDALAGIISAALVTGLFFARFSRARVQLAFSKDALIAPYRNTSQPSFQFRLANTRNSKIINLKVTVTFSWVEAVNGAPTRRFQQLPLERDHLALLPLNWTIVHIIDEESPLRGLSPQDFTQRQAEVIIFIEGFDESFGQRVNISSSYTCYEIRWGARFLPMYFSHKGQTVLDLERIHDFEWVEEEEEE
ncbi:MAG: transporter [Lewinella sp.]|nr:transporter [Lewinella sp.]